MPHELWIENLARRVIGILETQNGKDRIGEALKSRLCYRSAFIAAAREQGIDLSDQGRYRYAFGAVMDASKKLLGKKRPPPAGPIIRRIRAKRWIEHSLPPGDRD